MEMFRLNLNVFQSLFFTGYFLNVKENLEKYIFEKKFQSLFFTGYFLNEIEASSTFKETLFQSLFFTGYFLNE